MASDRRVNCGLAGVPPQAGYLKAEECPARLDRGVLCGEPAPLLAPWTWPCLSAWDADLPDQYRRRVRLMLCLAAGEGFRGFARQAPSAAQPKQNQRRTDVDRT